MNNLLIIRQRLGLSQVEFAAAIGVTQPAVSQYERGSCFPSRETALGVMEFAGRHGLKISLDEIYGAPSRHEEHDLASGGAHEKPDSDATK